MDRVMLLEELKAVTEDAVKDLIMPVKIQSENEEQQYRAAEVYLMRLPDGSAAKKKAPYIIHQAITSKDTQPSGELEAGVAVVRSIFAVYNDDEQEGGLMLLNPFEGVMMLMVLIGAIFTFEGVAAVALFQACAYYRSTLDWAVAMIDMFYYYDVSEEDVRAAGCP